MWVGVTRASRCAGWLFCPLSPPVLFFRTPAVDEFCQVGVVLYLTSLVLRCFGSLALGLWCSKAYCILHTAYPVCYARPPTMSSSKLDHMRNIRVVRLKLNWEQNIT